MIGGKIKKQKPLITKEAILERVSEYSIYRYYVGKDFKINKAFCSPFRSDSTPSFSIDALNVGLRHVDYGDYYWRGDCFDLVRQIYHVSFVDALKMVNKDFGLGLSNEEKFSIRKAPIYREPKIEQKHPPLLQVTVRKFTISELKYWEAYHQGLSDLKREHIYVPKSIYRNREKLPIKKNDLVFCYFYPALNKWKLYRPNAPKKGKNTPPWEWKWDSSITEFDYCDGLGNIHGQYGFLTKSRKDKLTLKTILETDSVADVQAEDPRCINDNAVQYFKNHCQNQIVAFDSDKKGKETSRWLTDTHGFKHVNIPDKYLDEGLTDFSDLVKAYGLQVAREHFKNKNLLINFQMTG